MEEKDSKQMYSKIGVYREDSPYSQEECDIIIKQLEELLDGELSEDEQSNILKRIESCEYCLEQYKIEKSFRQILKDGVLNFTNNVIINNIKQTIAKIRNQTFLF
jgi:anti-sigma factor (TIGR02949 family)